MVAWVVIVPMVLLLLFHVSERCVTMFVRKSRVFGGFGPVYSYIKAQYYFFSSYYLITSIVFMLTSDHHYFLFLTPISSNLPP